MHRYPGNLIDICSFAYRVFRPLFVGNGIQFTHLMIFMLEMSLLKRSEQGRNGKFTVRIIMRAGLTSQ